MRVSPRTATVLGLLAIILWGTLVGFLRTVSVTFGTHLGPALVYTGAALLLWITRRPRSIRKYPPAYLIVGGGMFVLYEVFLALAVAWANGSQQAIEVSVVNYLWPSLTVLFAALSGTGRRPRWFLYPGVIIASLGVAWVVGGDGGLSISGIAANVATNPVPYALALGCALLWALYSVFSPRLGHGSDGVTLFMTGVAVSLWVIFLGTGAHAPASVATTDLVALAIACLSIAAGYAFWNIGIARGNMTVLATGSYLTPILSALFSSMVLSVALTPPFWQGVALVTVGSLLSWLSTRR